MALWRDPLDELIADLERTLPNTRLQGFAMTDRACSRYSS
jgi:hypothetical protein